MSNRYPIIFAIGTLICFLWLGIRQDADSQIDPPMTASIRIDGGIYALFLGLFGARLAFLTQNPSFYLKQPLRALMVWEGGLSWVGGVLGALAGIALYSLLSKSSFRALADSMGIPAIFISFSAWFGCLLDRCAYGAAADLGWLTPISPDLFGAEARRWPVQGAGAILSLISILVLLRLQQQKPRKGTVALVGTGMISAINLLLAFFRGDSMPLVYGIRLDGLFAGVFVILALLGLALLYRTPRKPYNHHV